jgi:hypothetical protein
MLTNIGVFAANRACEEGLLFYLKEKQLYIVAKKYSIVT